MTTCCFLDSRLCLEFGEGKEEDCHSLSEEALYSHLGIKVVEIFPVFPHKTFFKGELKALPAPSILPSPLWGIFTP